MLLHILLRKQNYIRHCSDKGFPLRFLSQLNLREKIFLKEMFFYFMNFEEEVEVSVRKQLLTEITAAEGEFSTSLQLGAPGYGFLR